MAAGAGGRPGGGSLRGGLGQGRTGPAGHPSVAGRAVGPKRHSGGGVAAAGVMCGVPALAGEGKQGGGVEVRQRESSAAWRACAGWGAGGVGGQGGGGGGGGGVQGKLWRLSAEHWALGRCGAAGLGGCSRELAGQDGGNGATRLCHAGLAAAVAASGDAGGWCEGGGRVEPLWGGAQRPERRGVSCMGCVMHGMGRLVGGAVLQVRSSCLPCTSLWSRMQPCGRSNGGRSGGRGIMEHGEVSAGAGAWLQGFQLRAAAAAAAAPGVGRGVGGCSVEA